MSNGTWVFIALLVYIVFKSIKYVYKQSKSQKVDIKYRKKFPYRLSQFIGHRETIRSLKRLVSNYKNYGISIGHILLESGVGGLGKTTLAEILADELGVTLFTFIGDSFNRGIFETVIPEIRKNDIVFIDEIHKMRNMEPFYSVLQDFKYYNEYGDCIKLPIFSIIGATTEVDKIERPLLQRFNYVFHLNLYTNRDIEKILSKIPLRAGLSIKKPAIKTIAKCSWGIARIAINVLVRACEDMAIYVGTKKIDDWIVSQVLRDKKIESKYGLQELQIKMLKILNEEKQPMGARNLTERLQIPTNYLKDIEVPLLQQGWVVRTNRGRLITTKGQELLDDLSC